MRNVQEARVRKTKWFFENRDTFLVQLKEDLTLFKEYCEASGITPYVRLNGTSDISWEKYGIFSDFPTLNFYDYTKIPTRKVSLYKNYHLTFSRDETTTDETIMEVISTMNVAVVFNEVPVVWKGITVIDGDKDDLRIKDDRNVIVGLKSKGKARKDTSGFVVHI